MRIVALIGAALVALSGCGGMSKNDFPSRTCVQDSDCGGNQVCFADGCGDPDQGVVVEVIPDSRSGFHAQDFALWQLGSRSTLELTGASSFEGDVTRAFTGPYSQQITFRATGESTIIPGLKRTYELTMTPEQGRYALSVGTGVYSLLASPADTSVPPVVIDELSLEPGENKSVPVSFPSVAQLIVITKQIVKTQTPSLVLIETPMEVQAFDTSSVRPKPLSARIAVAEDGTFTLNIHPDAGSQYVLQFWPKDAAALVPRKAFVSPFTSPLVLGDYGAAKAVSGHVLAVSGGPIANASVYFEGKVQGGGVFRSATVQTLGDGSYSVPLLNNETNEEYSVWVTPGAASNSASFRTSVTVSSSTSSLTSIICPDKIRISSTVLFSDGSTTSGIRVTAEPMASVGDSPSPATGAQTVTTSDGSFTLVLDPGLYRLDIIPDPTLPRASRFVSTGPTSGASITLNIDSFIIGTGRTTTGKVLTAGKGLGFASVRFYRVTDVEGVPQSLLLGEGVTDPSGEYSVILPGR